MGEGETGVNIFERTAEAAKHRGNGYGHCGRCFRPWNICEEHATYYSETQGCFPLCQDCWNEMTPLMRLPFYRDLYASWRHQHFEAFGNLLGLAEWEMIKKAVLDGK